MAFELGAIIARIKADTSDFKKGINSAKGDLDGLNDFMGKTAGAARTLVTGLAAVGAGVVALGGFAVKSAASIEQTRIGFEGLIGDGTKAGNLMRDLAKFAAETPFEFPELAKSARLLMAFGDSAEDVLPHLRIIGDAVSTMGGGAPEIDRVTRAIGQMSAKGKITAEEMNQLSEIGINGFKLLADATGKSEAELRKLSEKGELMADEMLPKLYEQMQKDYGGGMAAQSKSLIGMWSTLRDELSMFGRELIGMNSDGSIVEGGIFYKIKQVMTDFLTWLQANKETIKSNIKQIFEWVQTNLPIIIGILGTLLVAAFASAAAAAVGFIVALAPLVAIGAALGVAFMALQPHFGTIADYITGTLVPAFQGFIGWLNQLWQGVLPMLLAAWAFLQPAFQSLADAIINQLWPALQNLWTMLQQVWAAIAPTLIPVLQVLGAILGGIIVGTIWLVVTAFTFMIGVISDVINWVSSMGQFFSGVINTILMIVGAAGVIIGGIFAVLFAAITFGITVVGNIFRAIFNTMGAIAAGVLNYIGSYWNMLVGVVQAVLGAISGIVSNIMQGNVKGAFQAALDGVKNIWNSITGFFSGIISNIISTVGRVKDGIVAPFRSAVDTIKNLMNGAKEALSNLNPFQRHSPSIVDWVKRGTKVIADEYGDMANSIAAGTTAARIETMGTARSFANVTPAQLNAQAGGGGRGGANITINLDGVLADSPEAKRRFGTELVQVINDGLAARGKDGLPA